MKIEIRTFCNMIIVDKNHQQQQFLGNKTNKIIRFLKNENSVFLNLLICFIQMKLFTQYTISLMIDLYFVSRVSLIWSFIDVYLTFLLISNFLPIYWIHSLSCRKTKFSTLTMIYFYSYSLIINLLNFGC